MSMRFIMELARVRGVALRTWATADQRTPRAQAAYLLNQLLDTYAEEHSAEIAEQLKLQQPNAA